MRGIVRLVLFVQAQKEDAARFEIALDIVDDIADVDIATGGYAAVDDVFLTMWGWHIFEFGDFKSQDSLYGIFFAQMQHRCIFADVTQIFQCNIWPFFLGNICAK